MRVEQVTAPGVLAEGPLWDSRHQRLMWVDIPARRVHAFDPATGQQESHTFEHETAALALVAGRPDSYLLASGLGVGLLHWPLGTLQPIATVAGGTRVNDGGADPVGRYLIGTMAPDDTPGTGALWSVADGRSRELFGGVTISNGLDWSPDGTTLYYVDTPLERIDAFDYDLASGEPSNRRVFVDLAGMPGRPDGLTVDAVGGIWVAMARGGAAVRRFTSDGRPDAVINLPVPNISSLALGGADLADLYVTTSTLRMTRADLARWPGSGAVFRICDVGLTGRDPHSYRP